MVNSGRNNESRKTDNYKSKFLSEIKPGDGIKGEIHIGEIKKRQIKNRDVYEFFVTLTNHNSKEKWICGVVTPYDTENNSIYGEKGDRVYSLIDTLNHVLNSAPLNVEESYSVKFDTFRKNINENVEIVEIKAVQSWKPGAKSVNLELIDAEVLNDVQSESEQIKDLTTRNNAVKLAYESLKNEGKDINKKSVAFELKHILDKEEIIKTEFKDALKELDNF